MGEVAAGHGLMELGDGDAARVRPGKTQVAQCAVREPGRPLEWLVDAVLVEDGSRGVGEQVCFGGQDPPAEALVLLTLCSGTRCEVRVREVRRRAGQLGPAKTAARVVDGGAVAGCRRP
ncbi:hypothetical protein AB0D94_02980 [Streptomyces sp. NPDC048255]|uniref:hypothetical protein n=1 Tax=Streptomyces sp. NPDC048255 TaxID=3154713 RepID=UPI0034063100